MRVLAVVAVTFFLVAVQAGAAPAATGPGQGRENSEERKDQYYIAEFIQQNFQLRTFHSPGQFKNHHEASNWGASCVQEHPGSRPHGRQRNGPNPEGGRCGQGGGSANTAYGYGIMELNVPRPVGLILRTPTAVSAKEGKAWVSRCVNTHPEPDYRFVSSTASATPRGTPTDC
ncbi:hypothetical protein ACQPZF_12220 [Actinosynnema sp. CS-041913]|uniref:hypothetical protein n=1 Tax=Actinosynnema sp. CS-041913 TaxID=3239917 RepID=UPI003D8AF920